MAQPLSIPLRSELPFIDGSREKVLENWQRHSEELGVNIQYNSEVTGITGCSGNFSIALAEGSAVSAENIVLAIGLQGNLNKLLAPGADLPHVGYQLDDPDEFEHEKICVIGAGDASIENALALSEHNDVTIINRSGEFSRAKTANESAVLAAINSGKMGVCYNSNTIKIEPDTLVLENPEGEQRVPCERIIARLGAAPPRKMVEACGIKFPNEERNALPEISNKYESNVSGLFVIGALGGFPLIKQALNQGYEVIDHILGEKVQPVDSAILEEKIKNCPEYTVDDFLNLIRNRIPIFSDLNGMVLRDTLLESDVHNLDDKSIIFRLNDYTNSLFVILDGEIKIHLNEVEKLEGKTLSNDVRKSIVLGEGAFFGEMGLISGRRRNATVSVKGHALLLEIPRRRMLTLRASNDSVREKMDREAIARAIQANLAPKLNRDVIDEIAAAATVHNWPKDSVICEEGEDGDSMHLIRRGSVLVRKKIGDSDIVLNYVSSGNYIGEMALISGEPRTATVVAAVECETIRIEKKYFDSLIKSYPVILEEIESIRQSRNQITENMLKTPDQGSLIEFLVEQGGKEATDILLIDDSLCVGCNNCEKACAATHEGISRLDREAGPSFADIHVPTTCRHCEHPHCMSDCPPDAIKRAVGGEVYIEDSCIGCGNCSRNCPYDVIKMTAPVLRKGNWLNSLIDNFKTTSNTRHADEDPKKAVKCDMCMDLKGGAACVRACPTGAAIRVHPSKMIDLLSGSIGDE